jgi:hypothetical protein
MPLSESIAEKPKKNVILEAKLKTLFSQIIQRFFIFFSGN